MTVSGALSSFLLESSTESIEKFTRDAGVKHEESSELLRQKIGERYSHERLFLVLSRAYLTFGSTMLHNATFINFIEKKVWSPCNDWIAIHI
mmetsp:Transcript_3714/g.5202  ORF Transcript_3714/g.5202 Transcript_3714/m.5202 type:complete len:92 (-) Transcript_3714:344-619(-)